MTSPNPDAVQRRDFLIGALATLLAGWAGGRAHVVGRAEVEAIRELAASVRAAAAQSGGEARLDEALRLATDAERLLAGSIAPGMRPEVATAVGWLATNVGALAHDAGREHHARAMWQRAYECSTSADNTSLTARVLSYGCRQALAYGDRMEALTLIDRALDVDRRGELAGAEQALLWALKAQADAQLGDGAEEQVRIAVGIADDAFTMGEPIDVAERPWMAHYDEAAHWAETAEALCTLARATREPADVAKGTGRYQAACRRYTPAERASRTMSLLSLARADLAVGDPVYGVSEGAEAVEAARAIGSRRVRNEVLLLGRDARRRAGAVPGAEALALRCAVVAA